jgi:hypothetical protein
MAQPLYLLGWLKVPFIQYGAGLFLPYENVHSLGGAVIGACADFSVCLLLGQGFVGALRITGPRQLKLQGLAYGLMVWVVFYGALINLGVTLYTDRPASDSFLMFLIHLGFGYALGWAVERYGREAFENQ